MERSEWDDDDLTPVGPLLPADDRIWRHPSELGPYVGASAARSASTDRSRGRFGLALVAGSAGALALAGALAVTTRSDPADAGAARAGGQQRSGMLNATSLLAPISTIVRALDPPSSLVGTPTTRAGSSTRSTTLAVATTLDAQPVVTVAASSATTTTIMAGAAWPAGSVVLTVVKGGQTHTVAAVVLGADGVLVTSAEAVVGATALAVEARGASRSAEVLGIDHETGIAVLHAPGLSATADLAAAAGLRRGAGVVIHVPSTAWTAKVSELGASRVEQGNTVEHLALLTGDDDTGPDTEPAVVTDNSGRVLGLCLMHDDKGRLMVPTELLEAAVRAVGAAGEPTSWLGVRGANLDDASSTSGGAVVSMVEPGSSAEVGGIRAGDVITAFDGRPVASMWGLVLLVRSHAVGSTVLVTYRRGSDQSTVSVLLSARPPDTPTTAAGAAKVPPLRIAG